MKEYTITPINTGMVNSNKANYLYHNSTHKYYDVEGNIQLPVTVFLVQSEDKKILIDTGMSSTEIANKYHHPGSVQPEGYAIYEQLEKMGISCDEITDIIYTHLHWDHVYYTPMFKNAKLYAQRKEYEFALNPIPLYYKSYEEPHLGIHPQWEGREFVLLDGECEVLDGISVYPTPGHSVGHQTVVVNTKEGQFHCCGDLIFTYDNLKPCPDIFYDITPPSRFVNIVEEWHSIEELKKRYKNLEITVMVRGGLAINDATIEDAQEIGLTKIVPVISNGAAIAGTVKEQLSKEARKQLDSADVIIAKGMGNFESMYQEGINPYYLFLCKCDLFTRRFGVKLFDPIFCKEERLDIK